MKKRKQTKKERRAQRDAEREARGLPPGWARSEQAFARSEAVFWRDEFGIDVDRVGPAIVERVLARDVAQRAAALSRSLARWPAHAFWECSECGHLAAWPSDRDWQFSTCMGCDAAMTSERGEDREAEWIDRGPALAMVDEAASERALSQLLHEWIEHQVAEIRREWGNEDFDLAWDPDEVLEQVQDGILDGVVDDFRVVDWRIVAAGIASWLDDHPREVDPVDFLEVAHALLDDD